MQNIFRTKEIEDAQLRVITITIIAFIIMLLGYWSDNFKISSFATLGLFTLFYYRNIPMFSLVVRLAIIGLTLLLAFLLGLLSSFLPWTTAIVVAAVAFFSRVLTRLYDISKPGVLFYAMLSAMGGSTTVSVDKLPVLILFFLMGVVFSVVGGIIIKSFDSRPESPLMLKSLKRRFYNDPIVIIDGVFYSGALFISVYLSQGLKLQNPYWVTLACASILLGENLRAIRERHLQYTFGAIAGLILSSLIFYFPFNRLQIVILVTLFYALSQYFVVRNYAVANIFTNPLAILLSMIAKGGQLSSLIQNRLLGILIGGFLGLAVAYIMTVALDHYITLIQEKRDEG